MPTLGKSYLQRKPWPRNNIGKVSKLSGGGQAKKLTFFCFDGLPKLKGLNNYSVHDL